MTETRKRLTQLGRPHLRARRGALGLLASGILLAIAAVGIRLGPQPVPILICWIGMAIVVALAVWFARRARHGASPRALGRLAELAGSARAGSVLGVLPDARRLHSSPELMALADARAAQFVSDVSPRVHRVLNGATRKRVALGSAAALAGAVLFIAASPARGRAGSAFWHPIRALADAGAPIRLSVDRDTVRRGDSVQVTVRVPGAIHATLWTRGPGEPWHPAPLALDATGQSVTTLGPLSADLYVKATSGSRRSVERRVTVALAAFIAELNVVARFPEYLGRDEQPLVPGADTILLPEGTQILTTGTLSVAAAAAAWVRDGTSGTSARLALRGAHFSGRFTPGFSGLWRLAVTPANGAALEGEAPELRLRIIPDSAPVVTVPIPGRDTMLPIAMRQPLVVDVRDDHGISRVEIVSWRASRSGKIGEPLRQSLDASAVGDRALIQGELAGDKRGLLPGDTLKFHVEAWDNAPTPHKGQSPDYALRLAGLEELRAATRAQTREVAAAADSLIAAQSALSDRTRDLAEQRLRAETGGEHGQAQPTRPNTSQSGSLPFEASERAAAIERQQTELQARAQKVSQQLEQVARAAQAAGVTDTAFQARLAEVQQLLQRALTPELEEQLRDLKEALDRLDPEATRDALQRLAETQQKLRQELEQSRDLFRRAAIEGALATLAADAEDLRKRQADWNKSDALRPDTGAAAREHALAARAESLSHAIQTTASDLAHTDSGATGAPPLSAPQAAAQRAHGAMSRAAQAAGANQSQAASSAGAQAESALAEIPDQLRGQRDSVVQAWRHETLDALDRALAETADLAQRQQEIADALHKGDASSTIRSQQASVQEGTALVAKEIRKASARHAMVSPQLDRALGFAQRQMQATGDELGEAESSSESESAATLADQSVDALNATAHALARSRNDVSGAKSGTGFAEMMEQLAQLGRQQGSMNGETEGLMPMMGAGNEAVMERLQAVAREQRALANQLDRMRAEGAGDAAGAMAQEARDIAAQLEAGRLDPQTVRRQSLLYHHLLDAGRTITGPEPDEKKDRVSQAASIDSVHIPPELLRGATGAGPRFRYPTWDEMRDLTPEERRLVLDYFRRLNTPGVTH